MNAEKIEKAAESLVEYLRLCGSRGEQIPEDRDLDEADFHKITYRITSLFVAPTLPFLKKILDNEIPTPQEAFEITKKADPFLSALLEIDIAKETFFNNFDFMVDAWVADDSDSIN
jgi:hypothetical protein